MILLSFFLDEKRNKKSRKFNASPLKALAGPLNFQALAPLFRYRSRVQSV